MRHKSENQKLKFNYPVSRHRPENENHTWYKIHNSSRTNMYGSHGSKAMCKWRLVLSECSCTVFVSNYVRKLEFLKSPLFPD